MPDSEDEDATPEKKNIIIMCKRCGATHGEKDIEECRRVRREKKRCSRCGLIHEDYDTSVWIIDGFDRFDCEVYIPNVAELEMDGDTIILPPHVQSKIDEISPRAQEIKKEQEDAKKKSDT